MGRSEHVTHLVRLLTYVSHRNSSSNDSPYHTMFHSKEKEESLSTFIARLDQNIRCSESCYATALVFIDRITELNSDLDLNEQTVHRLFTVSLLLANQFLDDTAERTLQFARVAGFHPTTMARLKTDFLFRIQFRLCVRDDEVQGYSDKLQGRFSTGSFEERALWSGVPLASGPYKPDPNQENIRVVSVRNSPQVVTGSTAPRSRPKSARMPLAAVPYAPPRRHSGNFGPNTRRAMAVKPRPYSTRALPERFAHFSMVTVARLPNASMA